MATKHFVILENANFGANSVIIHGSTLKSTAILYVFLVIVGTFNTGHMLLIYAVLLFTNVLLANLATQHIAPSVLVLNERQLSVFRESIYLHMRETLP